MSDTPLFKGVFPDQQDVLALPVVDLDAASQWYAAAFGLQELERRDQPHPAVILERDGVSIGFAVNGGDVSQDGAAILVSDIYPGQGWRSKRRASRSGTGGSKEHEGEKRRPIPGHTVLVVVPWDVDGVPAEPCEGRLLPGRGIARPLLSTANRVTLTMNPCGVMVRVGGGT